MPLAPLDELVEHTRTLIRAAAENVQNSHILCEIARQLRFDNADFRDFLFEERMTALSLLDRRRQERSDQAQYSGVASDSAKGCR